MARRRIVMKIDASRLVLAFGLCLALAAPASAANVYRWTDDQGRLRFTDSPESIPAAQLHRTAPVERDPESELTVQRYRQTPGSRLVAGRRGAFVVPFERDGRLMRVQVKLNDRLEAPFIIDTAASFGVTLPPEVAKSLGMAARGERTVRAITANGPTDLELIALSSVTLGSSRVTDVGGIINPNLEVGLLGAEFLNQFDYSVRNDEGVIILEPLHD
jgi:clan AA aspartic protease (TIGR02281 family)